MSDLIIFQNILDPKWFTLEMGTSSRWFPAWYHRDGRRYDVHLFSFDTIGEARAEAEILIKKVRGVRKLYADWSIVRWQDAWWIEWIDENYDITQREGGFSNYKDCYFWAQHLAAERNNPILSGKILDFRSPGKPTTTPLTDRDRSDLQAAIDKHFMDFSPVQSNRSHVKTFDEQWKEGIKAFLPEPETADVQA